MAAIGNLEGDQRADSSDGVDAVMVYTTFPTEAAGTTVAEALVEAGLVACANILPGMTSIYIWQGKLEREREVAMVMKTRLSLAEQVVSETARLHPYDNPAVVVLPVIAGAPDFLAWIAAQTAGRHGNEGA